MTVRSTLVLILTAALAVVRGDDSFTGPSAEFRVETGDTLVLVAGHAAMDVAFEYLETRVGRETVTR
ncbi:MAG: hypothetical protein JW843_00570 [Candidatus Aminicenantes bacterium]|nr:hypothetical protein [Candidatus Aminicenantes bacterium]